MPNQAAVIPEERAQLVVTNVDKPQPGVRELLVKVAVVGLSPIDYKMQT